VLRVLYAWLVEEQEINANPIARMKPPIMPERPVPVVPDDGLRRLLKACDGRDFEDRRDTAIILLLVDIGPRRGELAGVKLADVDLDLEVITVLGRAAGRARSRSAARPVLRWTAISAPGPATARHASTGSGSPREDASPTPG
jgi:site-specific recombinase XerC